MFVNGIRTIPHESDRFTVAALNERGVLETTPWRTRGRDDANEIDRLVADGREVFRLECSSCRTQDGYLGIRPRAAGFGHVSGHRRRRAA